MKLLKKLTNWLKDLLKHPDHLLEYRLEIIRVLNIIKYAVNSDVFTELVLITHTKTDDKILIMVRQWLPKILKKWNLAKTDELDVALIHTVKNIQKMPEEQHGSHYLTIAGDLYTNFSGLPLDTAMMQIQETYNNITPTP